MDPPTSGSDPQETSQKWEGTRLPVLPFRSGPPGSSEKGLGYTRGAALGGTHVPFLVRFPAGW